MKRIVLICALLAVGSACKKAPPETNPEVVESTIGYSTTLYARIMAGKGSGVVGVPLEGVEITLRYGEASVGPILTDPSGSFDLDGMAFFPEGTPEDAQALGEVTPINVEIHMQKPGFRPTVEIMTFPVEQYKEFTFYLKGEGS